MTQGQQLADRQIEIIRQTYVETGSYTAAAADAVCTVSTARKYVLLADDLEELRNIKKADIVDAIASARIRLIEAIVDPERIKRASVGELATSVGILTDKHQLLTGKATNRTETGSFDSDRLSPDQQEKMAELIDIGTKRGAA